MNSWTIAKYVSLCILVGGILAFVKIMESLYLKGEAYDS